MQIPSNDAVVEPGTQQLSMKDLATILIKHYGHHEGVFEVGVKFNIGVGTVTVTPELTGPGAMLTVGGIGLSRCAATSPLGVDASVVNPVESEPAKKPVRKRTVK